MNRWRKERDKGKKSNEVKRMKETEIDADSENERNQASKSACAIKTYSSRKMQSCNTAVNDALRRIFGYNRWESIRVLRDSFGYKSITDIFGRARKKFYTILPYHYNSVVSRIARNLPDIVE